MGMLAAGVAHEINNPLSYVLYNVESLAQDLPKLVGAAKRCFAALHDLVGSEALAEIAGDGALMLQPATLDDAVDRAREALAGSRRIKAISRGLGTFSRVERVERSMVDLRYAIGCAVSMAQNEIKYRARLVEDYGQVPAVLASEGKLSQVFLNLLINAAHATDEGHVEANRIGIRTWTENGSVLAEVTDTGNGIPKENLERIFDPFFTTKPVGEGTGLGLTISHKIVEEHSGFIDVKSEPGKGTSFIITLPSVMCRE
jgi:signal transduction histidine kinase